MYFTTDLVNQTLGSYSEQINLDGYVFDAYLNMQSESGLKITDHPVETGSPITDNAYPEPKTFNLDILVSDTSAGKIPGQFGYNNRPINAYSLLESWQKERKLLRFNSKYGFYENVLVERISSNDDYTTLYSMRVSVSLKEVITTESRIIPVTSAGWMEDSINKGNQNATEAPPEVKRTILRDLEIEGSSLRTIIGL